MDCKHRIVILQYIQVQMFVYFNTSMSKHCIVKNCQNNSSWKNVSFFKILKKCAWLYLLRLGDSRVYPSSCICSNHFKEGDISQGKSLMKNVTSLLSTLDTYKIQLQYCLIYNIYHKKLTFVKNKFVLFKHE